jgi:RNA polymerase sigma factor (sigma-70 family)
MHIEFHKVRETFVQVNEAKAWNLSPQELEVQLPKVDIRVQKRVAHEVRNQGSAEKLSQAAVDQAMREAIEQFHRDAEILEILLGNDEERRADLMQMYEKKWDRYVQREFSTIDAGSRAQIVGDMIINLANSAWVQRYRLEGPIEAFFYQALRRLCLNWLRKYRPGPDAAMDASEGASSTASLEQDVEFRALLRLLDNVLDRIATDQTKSTICRILFGEMKPHEVAQQDGITSNAARLRAHRLIGRLRSEPRLQEWWEAMTGSPWRPDLRA